MTHENSIEGLRPIRLVRHASAYHRLLRHRFAVPRTLVNPAIRFLKHLMNPSEKATRTRLASKVPAAGEADRKLVSDGYVRFEQDAFPDLRRALDHYSETIGTLVAEAEERAMHKSANKPMLTIVLRDEEFFDLPQIMEFAVSRPLVNLATRYLGRVPLLTATYLWWSPANDTMQQSQLYHCDGEDARQLKFFFNVSEVTPEHGPFTLLPGGLSDRIRNANRIVARKVTDEEIAAAGGADAGISLTGQPGEGACVDTCRCLHFGSRGNSRPRIMLMFRFNDHLAPNVDLPDWHSRAGEMRHELDPLQKLVLGIRP